LLKYAELEDLNLLPLAPKTKNQPLMDWTEFQKKKTPKEKWHEWFIEKDCNIAVICGESSDNLVIVDCDAPKLAEKIFGKHIEDRTFTVETGGDPKGRRQVYFKADYPVKGRKFHDIHVEILGQGNYGVYPSSVHPDTGRKYKALKMKSTAHIHGDFIEELYEMFSRALGSKFKPEKQRETIKIDALLQGVKHGERDEATVRLANWLRMGGAKEEEAETFLLEWNEKNYDILDGKKISDPLEASVIEDKVSRAYGRPEPYHYKFDRVYVPETVYPPEILAKADEILTHGKPLEYVNKAVRTIHAGDKLLIRTQYISVINCRSAMRIKANLWQIGRSQTGKSHSMYSTLQGVPKEYYEVFTSSSPVAFFYYIKKFGEWSLDKKLIYIDELEASKTALPTLRSLTGQTAITPRHLSVHEAELLDLEIKGKRAVWFTSVETFGSEQIKNRFIHLNPDETPDQDDSVFDLQMNEFWHHIQTDKELLLVTQAMTQKISKETVNLELKMPSKGLEWPYKSRRWLFPIFAAFIDAIARIHYKQRKIKDNKIYVTKEDIEEAKTLWKVYEKNIVYRVSATAISIYELIPEKREDAITHAEIAELVSLSTEAVRLKCKELTNEGLINSQKRTGGRGAWEYWKSKQLSVISILENDQQNKQKKNKKLKIKNKSKVTCFVGQTQKDENPQNPNQKQQRLL